MWNRVSLFSLAVRKLMQNFMFPCCRDTGRHGMHFSSHDNFIFPPLPWFSYFLIPFMSSFVLFCFTFILSYHIYCFLITQIFFEHRLEYDACILFLEEISVS